jgi:tRNA uridine 5-carboxymethylaminomethyl modification enzyme
MFSFYFVFCSTPNLSIREAMVTDIILGKNDNVEGVCTFFGMKFYAPSVILTTGTFMSGKIWVGRTSMPAGRAGESASHGLTENLQQLGFESDRLKTGTPARVDIRTVDFSGLEPQHGDEEVLPFNLICRFNRFISIKIKFMIFGFKWFCLHLLYVPL